MVPPTMNTCIITSPSAAAGIGPRAGAWSNWVLFAAAAIGAYLCYQMALPCISALAWAGALALLFAPAHRWIESKVIGANLAAALSVAILGSVVIFPATWFGQRL